MSDLLQSALKLGRNKEIAREEYLVAMDRKDPAAFAVVPSSIELSDLSQPVQVNLQLGMTSSGYVEIEVFCPDSFIVLPSRMLNSDDFSGGNLDLTITILPEKLHGGMNYSCITFGTAFQEIRVPVSINNPVKITLDDYNSKQTILELCEIYFNFRKGMMDSSDWAKRSLEVIGTVDGNDRQSMFLMIFEAQLHLELEEFEDAANLLEYMADLLQRIPGTDRPMNAYFSYVRALYERDRKLTEEICGRVRTAYREQGCWQMLWILFQLDREYDESPGLKLDDIASEFDSGCKSPILFFEALEIFRQYPAFLSDASDFELQILNLGAKLDYFTPALVSRAAEIFFSLPELDLLKRNLTLSVKILKYLYAQFPSRDILRALCRVLITKNDVSPEAGALYDLAVREYIDDIPDIFSNHLKTRVRENFEILPVRILEYFTTHPDELRGQKACFYANIVANQDRRPEYYRTYQDLILEFAGEQMAKGAIDRDLALIYEDIIRSGRMTHAMRLRLYEILSTKEIICHNPRMRNVMVFHDELSVYQDIPLNEGRARIKLYSHNSVILFKDITGNIYANIEYERIDFLNTAEYIDLCVKGVPISDYMLLSDTMPLLRGYKDPVEILNYMTHRMNTASFRAGYVKKLINDTVLYFSRNMREQDVYDELLAFFRYDLAPETRGKLIEVMIERTMYRDAFDKIREEGFEYIAPESLARLCGALVELSNYKNDELLLAMCEESFLKTTFEPRIFKYLVKNYEGRLEVLEELYRAGRAYGEDYDNLPEKILRRVNESDEDSVLIPQIFAKYYTEGADQELKKQYMNYKAGRYLYFGEEKDTDFFKYIENDLMQREAFPISTTVAYLKYMSDKDISGKRRMRMIEVHLKALVGRSIMLEEFKGYRRYFELPGVLSNSVIITRFGSNAKVVYDIISKDKVVHKEEQMAEIFEGCFAKYITLFYGERVEFSIGGGERIAASYSDLEIVNDESRYSELNNIIRMKETGNMLAMNLAAKEYFVKDKIMERLF